MEQPMSLAGIPIHLEDRLEYLFQLARALALGYPELQPILGELRVDTTVPVGNRSDTIESTILGYSRPADVYSLIVKDWAESDRNECDVLTGYFDDRGLLKGTRSAYICGAGISRLADYLGGDLGCERVVCSDLSWIALHLGRLLLEGRENELPAFVRRPRSMVDVDEGHSQIVQKPVPLVLKKPHRAPSTRLEFEVRNAFAFQPVEADLVLVCNFVESFRGRTPATLTAQIARQGRPGQRLLHVTWVSPEEDTGRRPEEIVELVGRCGFDVDWVDFLQLPYSTNNWCVDSSRSEWKNFVLMATRRRDPDEDGLYIDLNRRDAWLRHHVAELIDTGVQEWGGGVSTVRFTEIERALLRVLRDGLIPLAELRRRLSGPANEIDRALARLTGRLLVTIQVDGVAGARLGAARSTPAA
jgi:hypothetical protein